MAAVWNTAHTLDAPGPAAVAPPEFRAAMGSFATGITIVTACDAAGAPVGLTANSFNAVSLAPPLVLWSLAMAARSMPVFRQARHFAVNVLAAEQRALAERFAGKVADRFAGIAWQRGLHGCPLIDGAAASFECLSRSRHDEGDHSIFIGEVQRCVHRAGAQPLVFHAGRYVDGLGG